MRSSVAAVLLLPPISPPAVKIKLGPAACPLYTVLSLSRSMVAGSVKAMRSTDRRRTVFLYRNNENRFSLYLIDIYELCYEGFSSVVKKKLANSLQRDIRKFFNMFEAK